MQEIVLLLTGVAGAASAAAYRRMPRGRLPRGGGRRGAGAAPGAAGRLRSRIGALAAERDMLGKAISRVHGDEGLGGPRRDALLAMYQRQLSAVLAKIDRLEEASRYPDLGPVGDGLAELMDLKLSSLDERLHELSARIAAAVPAAAAGVAGGAEEEAAVPAAAGAQRPAAGRKRRPGRRAAAEAGAGAVAGAEAGAGEGAPGGAGAESGAGGPAAQQAALDAAQRAAARPQGQQLQRAAASEGEGPRAAPAPPGGRRAVKPVEITTLTTIGGGRRTFPEVGRPRDAAPPAGARPPPPPAPAPAAAAAAAAPPGRAGKGAGAIAQAAAAAAAAAAPAAAAAAAAPGPGPQGGAPPPSLPSRLPKPRPSGAADEEPEAAEAGAAGGQAADDDLAAIVADIRSTLSKLEQAEVE